MEECRALREALWAMARKYGHLTRTKTVKLDAWAQAAAGESTSLPRTADDSSTRAA